MLTKLTVKNLGCFDPIGQSVDLSPETLFCGPNNSGKSMFIAAINLVRTWIFGSSFSNELLDLTNFKQAIHNQQINQNIEIELDLVINGQTFSINNTIGQRISNFTVNGQNNIPAIVADYLRNNIWYLRPNRVSVPFSTRIEPSSGVFQPLNADGSNVITFLLEKFTNQDERWTYAAEWIKKIDRGMSKIKTPITGNNVSIEMMFGSVPVNISLQGSGVQSALAIISALIFSPNDSTIIIEEPEAFLHPESQETLLDLINFVVKEKNKQVIFTTHSSNILLNLFRDTSKGGANRGDQHITADETKFSMWTFRNSGGQVTIDKYPIESKTRPQFVTDFKIMWG